MKYIVGSSDISDQLSSGIGVRKQSIGIDRCLISVSFEVLVETSVRR